MTQITIDNINFQITENQVLWTRNGQTSEAPAEWAEIAKALSVGNVTQGLNKVTVNTDAKPQLLEHFIDSHDNKGNAVPGGRESGLHFPVARIATQPGAPLGQKFLTGTLHGVPVVSVLC